MELPTHPLLSLVENNANGLKLILKNYIDATVDSHYKALKLNIVEMIQSGQIGPQITEINAFQLNNSNEHQITYPPAPLETASLIKQECDDSSSSTTISINLNSNFTPNIDIAADHLENIGLPSSVQDQSNNALANHNEDEDEFCDCEDCLYELEEDGGDDETSKQNKKDDEESRQLVKKQKVDTTQSLNVQSQVKGKSPIKTKQVNSQIECDATQQSIPSTSRRRWWGRKRIPKKMFSDDDQTNDQVKSGNKMKSSAQSSKAVKKVKHQGIDKINQEEDEDTTKSQVETLEMNCTKPGCNRILNSFEMLKQHLLTVHGQMPYKKLVENVRHNQQGQTEYPCTECDTVSKTRRSLYQHWRMYHLAGKFQCSTCEFVANFWCEVRYHHRNNHFTSKFQCTFEGCNKAFRTNHDLAQHKRAHNDERPFKCVWGECRSSFYRFNTAICHVRMRHFNLPKSVKEQNELNIIDERDPKVFVQGS